MSPRLRRLDAAAKTPPRAAHRTASLPFSADRRRRLWHLLVVLALVSAACGGDSGSGSAPFGGEEFGLSMGELSDRAERGEQLIGECMAEAGFEYVPVDFGTIREAMTSDKSAPGMSGSEFRASSATASRPRPTSRSCRKDVARRNIRIFDALPPADQMAYLRTLYGDDAEATWAYALELEDFSRTGGCTRAAAEALFTPEELTQVYLNPQMPSSRRTSGYRTPWPSSPSA